MVKTNRSEYDHIISLGGSCNVASQLKHRGLRTCSFPLDWTLMPDERPVRWLPTGIRTGFRDFCVRENMRVYQAPMVEYGVTKQRLEDSVSGFRFIHQFSSTPENEAGFQKERSVLQRRIDRFNESVAKSRNVLFVLGTTFSYENRLLEDVYHALVETFPDTCIELAAVQFSAENCSIQESGNGNIHIMRCERPVNIVYDNQLTAPEWAFMDQLSLTGRLPLKELRKRSLSMKWRYKLWMWLGRSLENDGAGCANMRFYKFGRYL